MKNRKLLLLLVFSSITTFIFSQTPQYNWAIRAGSTGHDGGNAVVVDAQGNTYSTGAFSGTVDFDPGPGTFTMSSFGGSDVYILKTDANGNFVWAKKVGSGGVEDGRAIAISPSGFIYITGFFTNTVDFDPGPGVFPITSADGACNSEIFILKLDVAGNFIWAKSVWGLESICTSLTDEAHSIKLDNNGNVYVTGEFQGRADFNTSTLPADTFFVEADDVSSLTTDLFILKLNSSGDFKWVKTIGNALYETGYGMHVSPAGNVYVTGLYSATTDFDPGPGVAMLPAIGNWDCFIMKLDTAGNYVWAKGIGGSQDDRGFGVTTDAQENVYTTGFFTGTVDFDPSTSSVKNLVSPSGARGAFVLKLNSVGNYVWAKAAVGTIAGGGERSGQSITIDNFKNTYITGHFTEKVDFNPSTLPADTFYLYANGAWNNTDAFILKLDSMGNFNWAISMGSTGVDRGTSIFVDQNYNIYTTGYFAGTVDFNPGTGLSNLTSAGSGDVYIQKLSQNSVTGIESALNNSGFSVFPNPTKDKVNFRLKSNAVESFMITVYDVTGRKLEEKRMEVKNGENVYEVDLHELQNGMYLLQFNRDDKVFTAKIIKD